MSGLKKWSAFAPLMWIVSACSPSTTQRLGLPPLQAVEQVQLDEYVGKWYDVAHFPQSFQKNCYGTTATYSARDDGQIDVLNECRKGSLDGKLDQAKGRAKVVPGSGNAKLKVSFFRPFWGDYWIIELEENYQYAVVGHPSRDYLWILSRTPVMDPSTYDGIVKRLKDRGYETELLEKTVQREGN